MQHTIGNFLDLAEQVERRPYRRVDPTSSVWIFGAGNFGCSVSDALIDQGIDVAGFVETNPRLKSVHQLPVVDWEALAGKDPQAQIALGIFNRNSSYDELIKIPQRFGFDAPLLPWEIYDQFSNALGWRYWLSKRADLLSQLHRIAAVADRLGDNLSRELLLRICAFRLGLDNNFASYRSPENQYFNVLSIAALRNMLITYVDCGAYNGDTYYDLIHQQGIRCGRAFLLEPDPANFSALVRACGAANPEVVCLPLGVADSHRILGFSSGQGEGSAVGVGGDVHISVASLDEMFPSARIDLIKLDVEGGEAQALLGATRLIKRSRPVLTMSLYHKPQALWELPELLFDVCSNYDFFIRQHYYNSFDCVLYAVPKTQ